VKTELTALDVLYIVEELQQLVGSRVDRIYQPDGFLIQLHKAQLGKVLLRIEKNIIWLTASKPEVPETIPGLCAILRKRLEGKKLISLQQMNGERIIRIDFATQQETFHVYVELFANGNLILADKEDKIIAAVEERAWKDRAIKRGLPYMLPPSKMNVATLEQENFELHLTDSISKHLATLGFGKTYSHELCRRTGIEPNAKTITTEQQKKLYKEYQKMLSDKIDAQVYPDGEIAPIKLASEGTKYPTFSAAIDSQFATNVGQQKVDRKRQTYLKQREKVENLIALQGKSIKKNEEDALEQQRIGELIYEHYQELKEIMDEINKAKMSLSLQEIKARLKGHPKVKDVNPKTSEIVVEI